MKTILIHQETEQTISNYRYKK